MNQVQQSGRRAPPPALDPERPALVQPYKLFVGRGWITSYELKGGPLGTTFSVRVSEEISNDKHNTDLSAEQAKSLIQASGLWSPGTNKKTKGGNPDASAPKRSLVSEDFVDESNLLRRANAVAKAIGGNQARGRVGSLKMMIPNCPTFDSWWAKSPSDAKARLLTDEKHFKTLSESEFSKLAKVLNGKCPFRGSVPTPAENKAADDDSDEEPVTTPSRRAGKGGPSSSRK